MFAGSLAAAGLCAAAAVGAEPLPADHEGSKPDDLSAADWDEVQARYRNALRVYGARISAEQRRRLLHILTTNEQMLASIRTFTVQNGDASACTLRLVPGESTADVKH